MNRVFCNVASNLKISNKVQKQKFVYYTIIILICIFMIRYYYFEESIDAIYAKEPTPIEYVLEPKQPFRKNIFFAKTHKTASSTVQNILMRFGLRHSLNFLLPKTSNELGYMSTITDYELDEELAPPDGKFNIFAHHSRYHPSTNRFLYNDAVHVTILRSPPELFESIYHFFELHKSYGLTFQQLLDILPQGSASFNWTKREKDDLNKMSFDLGFEKKYFDNETKVNDFIKFLDQEFDYVMIYEHIEASLVLLADLMGWPLEYVSSLPLMKREETFKYRLTDTDKFKLSQLNHVDTLIYNHFLKKFRDRVVQYGESRMVDDMQKLHQMNNDLFTKCIFMEDYSGFSFTKGYVLKDPNDWVCIYSSKQEILFTDEVRELQRARLKPVKMIYKLIHKSDNTSL